MQTYVNNVGSIRVDALGLRKPTDVRSCSNRLSDLHGSQTWINARVAPLPVKYVVVYVVPSRCQVVSHRQEPPVLSAECSVWRSSYEYLELGRRLLPIPEWAGHDQTLCPVMDPQTPWRESLERAADPESERAAGRQWLPGQREG